LQKEKTALQKSIPCNDLKGQPAQINTHPTIVLGRINIQQYLADLSNLDGCHNCLRTHHYRRRTNRIMCSAAISFLNNGAACWLNTYLVILLVYGPVNQGDILFLADHG